MSEERELEGREVEGRGVASRGPEGRGLEARGLAIAAGGEVLFDGLDLHVAPGEALLVSGPSGTGKTTLLRALAGLAGPHAGEVTLDGRTPEEIGWPAWRRDVVLVAQRPVLLSETVGEALRRPFTYRAATAAFSEDRAVELLERLALTRAHLERLGPTLSEGQAQRVALARALLLEPRVLLLDEPTASLDAEAARLTVDLLAQEQRRGCALVLVSHAPETARALGGRSLILPPEPPRA